MSTMTTSSLHLPAGKAGRGAYELEVTPESAGWGFSSLRILALAPEAEAQLHTGDAEVIVLPLSGAADVATGDQSLTLTGRSNVFSGPTDTVYLPPGASATVRSAGGGRFALCGARTDRPGAPSHLPAADVPVELRGAGQCSRHVRNFGTPDALDAGAIIACEVITPGGNWSSYPAHKHDEETESESVLEEIYYFEIAAGPNEEPGLGYFRTSASPGHEIDVLAEIRDRDTVLVPYGWHGPAMAAPGFDMYYLNVMAGPGEERAWKITDHPEQAWIRGTWKDS